MTKPTPSGKGRGQPRALTPDVQKELIKLVSNGMPIRHACGAAGIHRDTLYGARERGECPEFFEDLDLEREAFLGRLISDIANDPDWRAKAKAAEFLDRTLYGKESTVTVKVEDLDKLSDDELATMAIDLAAKVKK